jgi:threonine dehydrogenase-like Zn-dependent dehydrogenase/ribulose-5-phosphate 4-epimerase/fuculose-1-phosphate aldolase
VFTRKAGATVTDKHTILEELVALSRRLGEPHRDLVMLGEGNTSALADEDTFWVKASGTQLSTIDEEGFVEVDLPSVLALLDHPEMTNQEVIEKLKGVCVEETDRVPSVETFLHALLLSLPGVRFVGHTHSAAANAILCSDKPDLLVTSKLFPDDIVCTGPAAAYVPYTDPGLQLALAVRDSVADYRATYGATPKLILMQNHGIIALGGTPREVESITYMHVKACRVALGAASLGGIHFLEPEHVATICARPDEKIREAVIFAAERGSGKPATSGDGPDPTRKQLAWLLRGAGVENLGGPAGPEEIPVPEPGADELLARVDACGICFSDLKIIRQGGDHPRLYGRDLAREPIVMGHEVALTLEKVGANLRDRFAVGDRFVMQADIFYKGKGIAFGYMLPGGYEQYVLLGDEVLRGDDGCYLIPIHHGTTGHAQAALAEPWACVIRAYKASHRTSFAAGGVVWIVGSGTRDGQPARLGDAFETPEHPKVIVTTDVGPELFDEVGRKCAAWGGAKHLTRNGIGPDGVAALRAELAPRGLDDIVLIGASDPVLVAAASAALGKHGVLALVGDGPELPVSIDVGRVHYEGIHHLGAPSGRISDAYVPARSFGLLPGGKAWFVGAAGPMGQMHVQYALEMDDGPRLVVGTDIDDARLEHLRRRLAATAAAKGTELVLFNPAKVDGGLAGRLGELAPEGFDDVVVMVPVPRVVEESWGYVGPNGLMNIFAGLPIGSMAGLGLAPCRDRGARMVGTSGSAPEDLAETLHATETGRLDTNLSVAAVGGIEAFREGIEATQSGRFPGKIVCYPRIHMVLTGLPELAERVPNVAAQLGPTGEWTVAAERELLGGVE